jgi:hypothetical protein
MEPKMPPFLRKFAKININVSVPSQLHKIFVGFKILHVCFFNLNKKKKKLKCGLSSMTCDQRSEAGSWCTGTFPVVFQTYLEIQAIFPQGPLSLNM